MAAAVLTPVDLQATKTVLAQAVSDDPASVASRADIGLRLNGRTQRRASSCQTSHAPESTASPLLAPEFRHRWHPFDRRWITRVSPEIGPGYLDKTTPRIPRNMGRASSRPRVSQQISATDSASTSRMCRAVCSLSTSFSDVVCPRTM